MTTVVFGDGLAEVGQRRAEAQGDAGLCLRTEDQDGNVFAGMVGGRSGGVAAVVGGDDGEVLRVQLPLEAGQPGVKLLERAGISLDVVAVPVLLIEFD